MIKKTNRSDRRDRREAIFLFATTSFRMSAIGTKQTSACALHMSQSRSYIGVSYLRKHVASVSRGGHAHALISGLALDEPWRLVNSV